MLKRRMKHASMENFVTRPVLKSVLISPAASLMSFSRMLVSCTRPAA